MSTRATMAGTVAFSIAALALAGLPAFGNHMQADSGRIIVFDHVGGNAWWVEARLSGQDGGQVSRVQAKDDGGAWVDLQLKSWGAWAGSFHIEPGHRVMFRASWSGGAMQDSCWFTHPAGAEQCGATTPPPQPAGVSFDHKGGNEWWVEAKVTGSPSKVESRDDGGAWVTLQPKDWGNWAGSYRIEPGHKVQFRATVASGVVESCWFTHPGGLTPTGGQACEGATGTQPPAAFDATFSGVKGNAYWVEARVTANQPVASVAARVDGNDPWRPLTLRSWGAWAASFGVPDGSLVQLRACTSAGACDLSDTYLWPAATVANWPVEGSYAVYQAHWHDGSPVGDVYAAYDMTASFLYTNGAWQVTCSGTDHWHNDHETPSDTYTDWTAAASFAPPSWPTDVAVGENVTGPILARCGTTDFSSTVVAEQDEEVGEGRFAASWQAYYEPCPCQAYEADWARHQGILFDWSFAGRGSGYFGELVETDAPIGLHP